MENPYSHKQCLMEMQRVADEYGEERKILFRPLMLARKVLTNANKETTLTTWLYHMRLLVKKLEEDDRDVIYRVISLICYRDDHLLERIHDLKIDELIKKLRLDDMTFYNHYYNEEMQQHAHYISGIELMKGRTKLLLDICNDPEIPGSARVNAIKELTKYAEDHKSKSKTSININTEQAVIPINAVEGNSLSNGVPWDKLEGQGDKSFRQKLKEADPNTIESTD